MFWSDWVNVYQAIRYFTGHWSENKGGLIMTICRCEVMKMRLNYIVVAVSDNSWNLLRKEEVLQQRESVKEREK